jgi:RNA polymerase sigma-70 factor (ECF subfamily)
VRSVTDSTDDRTLAALGGDHHAMDWLIGRWLPQVYSWCARFGAPDPEEAATDVLLLLVRRRTAVDGPDHLPSWLLSTCRRVVANHKRRIWWHRWIPGLSVESWSSPLRTDQPLEERELAAEVEAVLEELSADHREVLVLCYVEERSVAEVAGLLGIPAGTVKSRLFNARARFAERYRGKP